MTFGIFMTVVLVLLGVILACMMYESAVSQESHEGPPEGKLARLWHFHVWEYGVMDFEPGESPHTQDERPIKARRNRRTGEVQFVLWAKGSKQGEHLYEADYWQAYNKYWWPRFVKGGGTLVASVKAGVVMPDAPISVDGDLKVEHRIACRCGDSMGAWQLTCSRCGYANPVMGFAAETIGVVADDGSRELRVEVLETDADGIVRAIEDLREDEGESVEIISRNADFNGEPNDIVDVVASWTNWEKKRFGGDTLLQALQAAVKAKREWEAAGKPQDTLKEEDAGSATEVASEKIIGTGFYRDAKPGSFGRAEWLDLLMACQDGRATCMRVVEIIEREMGMKQTAYDGESDGRGFYVASKVKHAALWRQARSEGVQIISTWIDEAEEGQTADYSELSERCLREIRMAEAVVLYCAPGEILKGALIEVGAALALGKEVRCVGNCESVSRVFKENPLWRECADLFEATNPVRRRVSDSTSGAADAASEARRQLALAQEEGKPRVRCKTCPSMVNLGEEVCADCRNQQQAEG